MQFRHPESYRILSDGRILQDPMGSGVGYVDLGGLEAGRKRSIIKWNGKECVPIYTRPILIR
jgi:hypothetical protein